MINLIFQKGSDLVGIEVNNHNLTFMQMNRGYGKYSGIEGLKFDQEGIIKEFPDLIDKPFGEQKIEAIRRLKSKIKTLNTEEEIKNYLKEDLAKHGYKLKGSQRAGFRMLKE
jgi:hypothetical protein